MQSGMNGTWENVVDTAWAHPPADPSPLPSPPLPPDHVHRLPALRTRPDRKQHREPRHLQPHSRRPSAPPQLSPDLDEDRWRSHLQQWPRTMAWIQQFKRWFEIAMRPPLRALERHGYGRGTSFTMQHMPPSHSHRKRSPLPATVSSGSRRCSRPGDTCPSKTTCTEQNQNTWHWG